MEIPEKTRLHHDGLTGHLKWSHFRHFCYDQCKYSARCTSLCHQDRSKQYSLKLSPGFDNVNNILILPADYCCLAETYAEMLLVIVCDCCSLWQTLWLLHGWQLSDVICSKSSLKYSSCIDQKSITKPGVNLGFSQFHKS